MCAHMMYTTLRSFFLYFENSGYHIKMTKSIFCAVFIILTLGLFDVLPTFKILYCFRCQNKWYLYVFKLYSLTGLMANEIQGDMCGEVLPQVDCGAGSCGALCRQLKHGTPHCVRASNGKLACYCVYPCPS